MSTNFSHWSKLQPKANSVKQEVEKQEELKRSALRAVAALHTVRESEKVAQLADLLATIRASNDLAALFAAVQKDPSLGSPSHAPLRPSCC